MKPMIAFLGSGDDAKIKKEDLEKMISDAYEQGFSDGKVYGEKMAPVVYPGIIERPHIPVLPWNPYDPVTYQPIVTC